MYSMEKFTRFDSSASVWEKEGRCVCFQYLRISDLS
ncbi:hypothetical protein Goklo_025450 [Gossypium klotzschianum]|uniref:Uncharacterized protein n=1 Tax=Gossypium klotzschianum TaxID=34286 RepID=A0A7J8W8Z4_9ROSI|nr:hypothetical protein [Gossypium klotzschianum]